MKNKNKTRKSTPTKTTTIIPVGEAYTDRDVYVESLRTLEKRETLRLARLLEELLGEACLSASARAWRGISAAKAAFESAVRGDPRAEFVDIDATGSSDPVASIKRLRESLQRKGDESLNNLKKKIDVIDAETSDPDTVEPCVPSGTHELKPKPTRTVNVVRGGGLDLSALRRART
jgi:hypothetical protein